MILDDDPILSELEKIVSGWPHASYDKVVNAYPSKSVRVGTAHFPTCPGSGIALSVVAYASDSYDISVKCKITGEIIWSEIWEMSMQYLPDGTKITSAAMLAEFGSARIRLLLLSEWILLVRYGWITRQKFLIVRSINDWRVENSRTWLGSRLLVRHQTVVHHHVPSQNSVDM